MTKGSVFAEVPCRSACAPAAPRARIIYSSRTGNTRAVAEHLAARFGLTAVNAKQELAARRAEAADLGAGTASREAGCPQAGLPEAGRPADTQDMHAFDGPVTELGAMPPQGDAAGTDADILFLGMWAWRGGPNPTMRTFMRGLRQRRVFLFGTMAAWPDSPHAQDCLDCARALLDEGGNTLVGHFFCQGRLDPKLKGRGHHPLTPERRKRLEVAAHHPDMGDFMNAEAAARAALYELGVAVPPASS